MEADTRIYYTGDMANVGGFGVVRTVIEDPKWGYTHLVLRMDDGRTLRPEISCFSEGPGRRFYTAAEWKAKRAAQLAAR